MNIREYAASYESNRLRNWYEIFESRGYYHVIPGTLRWQEMHTWLKENIGEDHYIWHGEHFWFETQEAALLVALKWQ